MIEIHSETLIRIADVPRWTEELLRNRVHKSTVHRWFRRGCRGVKLETLMVGGIRHTSEEALDRFFNRVTAVSGGDEASSRHLGRVSTRSHLRAAQELASEGF